MKTKTVRLKSYDDGYVGVDLLELLDGTTVRPSTVKYYKIESKDEGALIITLYNKAKKRIKVKLKQPTEE